MAENFFYMTRHWQRINDESRKMDEGFRKFLIEKALPHQRAFNAVMMACFGDVAGVEFKAQNREVWGVICPNVPTKESKEPWRIQSFDAHGMIGHMCYDQLIDAIEDLARHYPVYDRGALDRVAATELWAAGLERQQLRDRYAMGQITYQQLVDKITEASAKAPQEGVVA